MTADSLIGSPISSAQPATAYSPGEADPPAIRFGVVGAGFIACWFLQAVRTVPRARVVAVTSARPESAAAFAAEHGIGASYATLEEMLAAGRPGGASPFDVVYIGSPNSLHASQTIAALEAGFHVLVEKPFALDAEQAEAMVAAAARHDRFLMEGWLTAFEPGTAALRRALPALLSDGPGPHRAVLVKEQYSSRMDRLRAGERARDDSGVPADAATDPVHALALLRQAQASKERLRLRLAGPDGAVQERRVRVLAVEAGRVRIADVVRQTELTVAVHRIVSVVAE